MGTEDLRIGDTERESAIQALGEHFAAGRLNVDEYGERSAKVTTAKTAGEVAGLFADLPAPHPRLAGQPAPPQPTPPVKASSWDAARNREENPEVDRWMRRPPIQRAAGALVGLCWVAGILLLITTHFWFFIFAPMILSAIFGSMWGRGWERDRHDFHHGRDRNRDRYRNR